jgi:hypothetical protein
VSAAESERLLLSENGYAESFLRLLGASEIVSFDASDYEEASRIQDFNLPLEKKFFGRFSVVLDGGTLEHIFNFPQAISNCMEMVEPGGHFLGITPANNFVGHGFYQFSPEVFFRIFSLGNGFAVRRMMAFESPSTRWYEVSDPEAVRRRVTLINRRETYLLVIAKKTATVPIFARPIQQSDYTHLWEFSKSRAPVAARSVAAWRSFVPELLKWPVRTARGWIRAHQTRRRLGFDGKYFRKLRASGTVQENE